MPTKGTAYTGRLQRLKQDDEILMSSVFDKRFQYAQSLYWASTAVRIFSSLYSGMMATSSGHSNLTPNPRDNSKAR